MRPTEACDEEVLAARCGPRMGMDEERQDRRGGAAEGASPTLTVDSRSFMARNAPPG